jgi:hypothetical protein
MMKNIFNLKTLAAVISIGLSSVAFAGVDTYTDENDVILAGHDAVAYFTQNKAVVGSKDFTAVHNDAIYRFSSAANRDLFAANPEKYAPAYGGFCAFGASFGKKFDIDGKAFEVVDGVLYVNKNLQVKEAWSKDIPKHIGEADGAWIKIEDKEASTL